MQAPRADGLLLVSPSRHIQVSMLAADAMCVVAKAFTAVVLAPRADPALNPNHPNHSIPVPKITYGMLAGWCGFLWFFRGPSASAPASAASPALMCTTVPPAKSSTPHWFRNPCGCQVQCASGV